MKSFELERKQKTESIPIVYVDMDGTLADFFGELARQHGVGHWRDIDRNDLGIDQIAQEPGFFADLHPLSNSGKLIRAVLQSAGKYSILSSPLLSDVDQSSRDKAEWLHKQLSKHPPESIVFDHNKAKYAKQSDGTPNILIDDYKTNIHLWRIRGGIGILYKNDEIERVVHELHKALRGELHQEVPDMAVFKDREVKPLIHGLKPGLFTSRQVLSLINDLHHDYHLEKPVLAHKVWKLEYVPVVDLNNPEYYHQDDPYRRTINLDWEHIQNITVGDISSKPVVADADGWVLDGNHRVTAAKAANIKRIPAFVPAD